MKNKTWTYKNHKCEIEIDRADNNAQYHYATGPDGVRVLAPISSYETNSLTLDLWIDCGKPAAVRGNWRFSQLLKYQDSLESDLVNA